MLIQTKYFGEIDYLDDEVLYFQNGLFGFEQENRFLLLPFAGSDANLLCLQSMQSPALAFIVMNPFSLKPDYAPTLQNDELYDMGVKQSEELCYYVLCVVRNPVSTSTVNLKCPVVINDQSRLCMQVILDSEDYDMRHPLSEFGTREAEGSC